MRERVGASIVEIITESLYDKPIVVFREYVQNSADSLASVENCDDVSALSIQIWKDKNSLYFLDNGTGIPSAQFAEKMGNIAYSAKSREENIGYKGIGRLSGLSYCSKLVFVNILDFQQKQFQTYTIDCLDYYKLRKTGELKKLQFHELMEQISSIDNSPNTDRILEAIAPSSSMFDMRNTGFLVILDGLSSVLNGTINDKRFFDELAWLLPVPFKDELLETESSDDRNNLFIELSEKCAFPENKMAPAKAYNIFFNGKQIHRPIDKDLLRDYLCRSNLEQYAVCVHAFSGAGISINSKNPFSGIRVYFDNILLCDESELVPALQKFGMISHSINETIQAVRGVGAMIYIVDKDNLSTNARRTFIDVADSEALDFLTLVGEFVENIFQARYALSGYYSAKKKSEVTIEGLEDLRQKAEEALVKLARHEIKIEDNYAQDKFADLAPAEQRKIIKSKIAKDLNLKIKRYLDQATVFDPENCFDDFITWLKAN